MTSKAMEKPTKVPNLYQQSNNLKQIQKMQFHTEVDGGLNDAVQTNGCHWFLFRTQSKFVPDFFCAFGKMIVENSLNECKEKRIEFAASTTQVKRSIGLTKTTQENGFI